MKLSDRKNLFKQTDSEFIRFFLKENIETNEVFFTANRLVDKPISQVLELFPDEQNKEMPNQLIIEDFNI